MDVNHDALLSYYAISHRDPRNELIHCICIPVIVFAVVGLLYWVGMLVVVAALVASLVYYCRCGIRAALEMAAMLWSMLGIWVFILPHGHIFILAGALFIIGWAGQFIGHIYEGAKPSFAEDLIYLLVGPLFVIERLKEKIFHRPG